VRSGLFCAIHIYVNPNILLVSQGVFMEQANQAESKPVMKRIKEWFGINAPDEALIEVGVNAKKVNLDYVFQPLLLKKGGKWLGPVGSRNLMIVGEAGSGKTSFFLELCSRMGVTIYAKSVSGDTKFRQLIGTRSLVNGDTVWIDGPLTKAVREDCVFLANEVFRMNAGEQMLLVDVLDRQGELLIEETGERLPFGPNFRFAATGNSGGFGDESGAYAGEKHSSLAFRDRFTILSMPPLDENQELKMLQSAVPDLKKVENEQIAIKMVKAARKIRAAFIGNGGSLAITVSPRALVRWGEEMIAYSTFSDVASPLLEALNDAVLNGCPEDTRQTVIELIKEWL
jgi:cobaltochelatase CobS